MKILLISLLFLLASCMPIPAQQVIFNPPTYQNDLIKLPVSLINSNYNVYAISLKIAYDTTKFQYISGSIDNYLLSNGYGVCNANNGLLLLGWFTFTYTGVYPTHIIDWVLRPKKGCSPFHFCMDLTEISGPPPIIYNIDFRDTTICNEKRYYSPAKAEMKGSFNILGQRVKP